MASASGISSLISSITEAADTTNENINQALMQNAARKQQFKQNQMAERQLSMQERQARLERLKALREMRNEEQSRAWREKLKAMLSSGNAGIYQQQPMAIGA